MDKVYAGRSLKAAWGRVKADGGAAGVDNQSIEAFQSNQERYLAELENQQELF